MTRPGQIRFAPGVMDKHFRAPPLRTDQAVNRAVAIIDRWTPLQHLLTHRGPARGRPRTIDLDVIARCLLVHSILVPDSQALTRITDTLWSTLNPAQRRALGLHHDEPTYSQVRSAIRALVHLLQTQPEGTLDEVGCALLNAAIPDSVPTTGAMAIGGTDIESWARASFTNADGERPDCCDRDARLGHRTATTNHPGEYYFGYAAHLATDVPTTGGPPVPHLARGLALRPANHANGPAGIDLLIIMAREHGVTECVADRGYTLAAAGNFAEPAHQLGISIDMDLHTNQQVQRPGPKPGTLWVDGTLYSTALPARLRHVPAPHFTQTPAEKAALRDLFDKRRAYQMLPMTVPTPDGAQRLRGPALRGKLRCPSVPRSMRSPHTTPMTACTTDQPCGCGLTVTVHRTDHQRDRQRLPWQSTAWFSSYGRRVGIESLNASIRGHHANINRGYIRVVGLANVTTLLAFGLAGMNTRILNTWYTSRGLADPWATTLDEPTDEQPPPTPAPPLQTQTWLTPTHPRRTQPPLAPRTPRTTSTTSRDQRRPSHPVDPPGRPTSSSDTRQPAAEHPAQGSHTYQREGPHRKPVGTSPNPDFRQQQQP